MKKYTTITDEDIVDVVAKLDSLYREHGDVLMLFYGKSSEGYVVTSEDFQYRVLIFFFVNYKIQIYKGEEKK